MTWVINQNWFAVFFFLVVFVLENSISSSTHCDTSAHAKYPLSFLRDRNHLQSHTFCMQVAWRQTVSIYPWGHRIECIFFPLLLLGKGIWRILNNTEVLLFIHSGIHSFAMIIKNKVVSNFLRTIIFYMFSLKNVIFFLAYFGSCFFLSLMREIN